MDIKSVKILGIRVDKVSREEAYNKFLSLFNNNSCATIYTPNPEIIMKARDDEDLKVAISDADLVVPDGIGIVYASKIHDLGIEERVAGIEFMERILNFCNNSNRSIYLLGAKPETVERAAYNIGQKYSKIDIVGYHDGYFDESAELKVIDKINEVKPDVLFVALGAPKQEKWIHKHKKILNTHVAMGVGGSFDVWSGYAKRAPKIFLKLNLEWLYRIIRHPSRIGRAVQLPKFLFEVIVQKIQGKS